MSQEPLLMAIWEWAPGWKAGDLTHPNVLLESDW